MLHEGLGRQIDLCCIGEFHLLCCGNIKMNGLASKEFLIGKALLTNGKSAGVPRDAIIKIQQMLKLFSRKCQ